MHRSSIDNSAMGTFGSYKPEKIKKVEIGPESAGPKPGGTKSNPEISYDVGFGNWRVDYQNVYPPPIGQKIERKAFFCTSIL